jgi:hypothetical protein
MAQQDEQDEKQPYSGDLERIREFILPQGREGRRRTLDMPEIGNAILYWLSLNGQWPVGWTTRRPQTEPILTRFQLRIPHATPCSKTT